MHLRFPQIFSVRWTVFAGLQCLLAVILLIACSCLVRAEQIPGQMTDESGVVLMVDEPAKGPAAGEMTAMAFTAPSGDADIDALLSSYRWGDTTITYSFYSDSEFNGDYYGAENASEVSNKVKENFREIFAWLESVINLDFVEVTEQYPATYGKIRIMASNISGYAYSYYPYSDSQTSQAGDIFLNRSYDRLGDTNGFQHDPGKHGYMTLAHELGHSLGLKHPFSGTPTLPSAVDNTAHTLMSYTFVSNSAGTYMPYDIRTLQYLYGSKPRFASQTDYEFQPAIDAFIAAGQLFLDSPNTYKQTLCDSGGKDTLDLSGLSSDSSGYAIDLRPGGWLIKNTARHSTYYDWGVSVAFDCALEKVLSSPSDDSITANDASNVFSGYAPDLQTGSDSISLADIEDTVDLSAFSDQDVAMTQDGDDLVLDLGNSCDIRIIDYFAGQAPVISFASQPPSRNAHLPAVYHLLLN